MAAISLAAGIAGCNDEPSTGPRVATPDRPPAGGAGARVPRLQIARDPASPYGLNVPNLVNRTPAAGGGWNYSPLRPEQRSALLYGLQESGAKWARIAISWAEMQLAQNGGIDWWTNGTDATIRQLYAEGYTIFASIVAVPRWANGGHGNTFAVRPEHLASWQWFLERLKTEYDGMIAVYSVFNEANCARTDADVGDVGFTSRPEFGQVPYDSMFARAAAVFGAAKLTPGEPSLIAVGGTGRGQCAGGAVSATQWLQDRLARPAAQGVRVVAVHDYDTYGNLMLARVRDVARQGFVVNTGREVWLTEFGVNDPAAHTPAVRDTLTSRVLFAALQGMADQPTRWVKSFYYRLWSPPGEEPEHNLLDATTMAPLTPWYAFRLFGNPIAEWRPQVHLWRFGDNMWSSNAGEQEANGDPFGIVAFNDWSVRVTGEAGWHPLFRCAVKDWKDSVLGHYVTQHWGCESAMGGGTRDAIYGYVSSRPDTARGLRPLVRYYNLPMTDYYVTTDSQKMAEMESPQQRSWGWQKDGVIGYAWPRDFSPGHPRPR